MLLFIEYRIITLCVTTVLEGFSFPLNLVSGITFCDGLFLAGEIFFTEPQPVRKAPKISEVLRHQHDFLRLGCNAFSLAGKIKCANFWTSIQTQALAIRPV